MHDFISYLKSTPGYTRILKQMKEKYISLGHFGGAIRLNNLTMEEREILRSIFKKGFHKDSASFSVEKFIQAFNETKFKDVDFRLVLEKYFNEPLEWKKVIKQQYQEEKDVFFQNIYKQFSNTPAGEWLEQTLNQKTNPYPILSSKYDDNKEKLRTLLYHVCFGINELVKTTRKMRLALFASKITKDPHAFDMNGEGGRLLLYALSFYYQIKFPQNAEEQSELLFKGGLITDEVSNHTLCRGIDAYIGDRIHEGWAGFSQYGEPLHISLWNISSIDTVTCVNNRVYVFENPTVFSEITGMLEGTPSSLICSAGNLKLSTLLLLDKIVQGGSKIFYSGDFDPEGLVIADKLKKRYRDYLILWHYNVEEYEEIKSEIKISSTRLKKLDAVESPELLKIAKVIHESKFSAYQELLMDAYLKDIINT